MVWKAKKEITKKKEEMKKILLTGIYLKVRGCFSALFFLNSTIKVQMSSEDAEEIRLIPKYIKCNEIMDRVYRIYHRPHRSIQREGVEPWPYPAA